MIASIGASIPVLLFGLLVWALQSPERLPQAPGISARQQIYGAVETQCEPAGDAKTKCYAVTAVSEPIGQGLESARQSERGQASDEASEFWTIFGRRLKITDTLLVVFAFLLWGSTHILARRTLRLVRSADETSRRELRAYVGHQPSGAIVNTGIRHLSATEAQPFGIVRYYEMNFGRTPASNIDMYVRLVPGIATVPDELPTALLPAERQDVIGYVPPGQNIGRIIQSPADIQCTDTSDFYLFGYVDYTDIFGHRWRHRFAMSYSFDRAQRGGEPWIAVGRHHYEEDLGPA